MRTLRTLLAVIVLLVLGLAGSFSPAASATSSGDGCFFDTDEFGNVTAKVCAPGTAPVVGATDGPGGSPSPAVCMYGDQVIPCTSAAGTWSGSCYVQATTPAPPPEDPVWEGRTDGAVLSCTPFPCVTVVGDNIEDCPTRTQFWAFAAPAIVIDEAALARSAVAQLNLDPIGLGMAPKPNLADPNVLIGAPAYFWAEGGPPAIGPLSTTVTEQGITITLNATMDTVTYDAGDGATLTCTRDQIATPPTNMTLQGTPDCGHHWESSGTYTLTATSNWTITWQGPTQNGTFDYTLDNAIDVAVTDRPVNLTTNKDY